VEPLTPHTQYHITQDGEVIVTEVSHALKACVLITSRCIITAFTTSTWHPHWSCVYAQCLCTSLYKSGVWDVT
jgi:hypothetical protein